jgi:phosphatidate cytidylyltransferase
MSPRAALESPVFRTYVVLVAGIAIVAWLSLMLLRRFAGRDVSHAFASFRGWLIMAPTVLVAIFLGRIVMISVICGLAALALVEYARATGLARDRLLLGVALANVAAMGLAVAMGQRLAPYVDWYELFLVMPLIATMMIVCVPILRNRTSGELRQITLAVFGFVYIGWMFGHLALLASAHNAYGYLMYLFFAVELNDISAYSFGRLFGRRPLRSNISPKKTWEGAFGGLAVSLALPWLLRFSFPHFSAMELILTGVIVGVGGQMGDLVISFIKRESGVKDMGAILPGHGGILDRIDSLIFVAPLFFHMVGGLNELYPA